MINQIQAHNIRQKRFAEYINQAYKALRKSRSALESLFGEREIYIIDSLTKGVSERHMEIRLETVTLTCTLNKEDICNGSLLFFDDDAEMHDCVEYCCQVYTYDYLSQLWGLKDGCIFTVKDGKDTFLALLPQ